MEFPIESLTLIYTLSVPLSIKYSQIDAHIRSESENPWKWIAIFNVIVIVVVTIILASILSLSSSSHRTNHACDFILFWQHNFASLYWNVYLIFMLNINSLFILCRCACSIFSIEFRILANAHFSSLEKICVWLCVCEYRRKSTMYIVFRGKSKAKQWHNKVECSLLICALYIV